MLKKHSDPISVLDNISYVTWNRKSFFLTALALQNTVVVLTLKYSRSFEDEQDVIYLASTAVVCGEIIKLILSILIFVFLDSGSSVLGTLISELTHIDTIKLTIPGLLYCLQNNLVFLALSNLPASVYQVTYQLKIVSTALMSVLLLGRSLNQFQIISLILLTVGVALVQLSKVSSSSVSNSSDTGFSDGKEHPFVGLVCVLLSSLTSGFAGVYMEKVIKTGREVSLSIRNIQLSFFGIILGLFGILISDWDALVERGFFQGYNSLVMFVIVLQAGGGILVAYVMKHADNILKGFASSISIVLSSFLSSIFLGFHGSLLFYLGVGIVISAILLYGYNPKHNVFGRSSRVSLLSKQDL